MNILTRSKMMTSTMTRLLLTTSPITERALRPTDVVLLQVNGARLERQMPVALHDVIR